ncbi:MAG TPA: hypothetical protein VHG09_05670 [Longimicrobiales bacterium]|nr:hypothetical protein [Longimicrobiales bacterium]
MIRRDVLKRDNRPVKWSLIAAAFALSLGLYAEHVLTAEVETDSTTAVVQKAVPAAPAHAVTAG